MKALNGISARRSRRRGIGEQAVQALAISSQMALLYPPGIDEWMRRELTGEPNPGLHELNGQPSVVAQRTNGAR
jgi:hypothetical protein